MPRNPNRESFTIRFGPYSPPPVAVGEEIVCELRGKVVVADWSDRPGIMWPRAHTGRKRAIILCGDLLRAIQSECEEAIGAYWGIHPQTVSNWRSALKITGVAPGAAAVLSQSARKQMSGKPAHPAVKAGLLRAAKQPKTKRWRTMLAARNKLRSLMRGEETTAHDADRLAEMLLMRTQGKTLEEIGQHFGVTREDIRQILRNATTRRERTKDRGFASPRCDCRRYSLVQAKKLGHECS